ncbi:hypothetical protein ACUH9Y_03570 [Dermabacteraceae bacterium P13115]
MSRIQDNDRERSYLDLIRDVHREWDELEAAGDSSVQLSTLALSTIKESVKADARRGSQVEMPETEAGPYTVSELALRTLVRETIDTVPGVRALRTVFTYAENASNLLVCGTPVGVSCRLTVQVGTPDLPGVAEAVRASVARACADHLGLDDIPVDIHIEDLHE